MSVTPGKAVQAIDVTQFTCCRRGDAEACVPANKANPEAASNKEAYERRHRVRNAWVRLAQNRSLATRYEKTAASLSADLHVAAMLDRLSAGP
jgi:transposase